MKKESKHKIIQKKSSAPFTFNFIYLYIFLFTFLLYGCTAFFDFGLDDNYIINQMSFSDNSFNGLLSVFKNWYASGDYRPIAVLSFWIERAMFGGIFSNIAHLINVFIFAMLLMGIYKLIVLSRMLEDEQKLKQLAILCVMFFLVHPNHVSVVANIKSRDNLLSMLFGLLSTIQFLKGYDKKQWYRFIFSILFLLFATLCKLDSYSFIFLPILILFFFRDINYKKVILFFIVSILLYNILLGIRDIMITNFLDINNSSIVSVDFSENPLVSQFTLPNRISMLCITLLYYVKFLIVPFGYYFYFGYNQIPLNTVVHPLNLLAVVLFLLIVSTSIYYYKKNRIYLFSVIFFLIAIAYASNFFMPVAGIVMDRYDFIASFAFCLCIASIIVDLHNNIAVQLFRNRWIVILLIVWSGFSLYRITAWRDTFTLMSRDIKYLDNSVNAQRMLGVTYIKMANKKNSTPQQVNDYYILAEKYIDMSLLVSDKSTMSWEAKGLCELHNKDYKAALEKFRKCIQLDSTYYSGINYMGVAFGELNNFDSAYYYYNYVMEKEGRYNYSADNLVNLLINNNRRAAADSVLNKLHTRFPDDYQLNKKIRELQQTTKPVYFK